MQVLSNYMMVSRQGFHTVNSSVTIFNPKGNSTLLLNVYISFYSVPIIAINITKWESY